MNPIDPFGPCPFPPGSAGKVAVLEARFALGLPLFNPLDSPAPALFRRVEAAGPGGVRLLLLRRSHGPDPQTSAVRRGRLLLGSYRDLPLGTR
jgi:hypothetical protein